MTPAFPAIQATHAYYVTPSDDADVKDDTANPDDATAIFLHNPGTAATVRVLPAGMAEAESAANAVTVYIPQGGTLPLAVRKVYATDPVTAADAFIGFYSKQR